MSTGRRGGSKAPSQSNAPGADSKPPVQFLPPLKPRPILMIVLLGALVVWLAALVVLRMTAVRPEANPATAPATR